MSFSGRFSLCLVLLAAFVAVSGCSPDSGQLDEEKEPHYVLGKSRVNAMDYAGAVEAFTESLEVNPRSAAAHFQLACLFDTTTREADPAAAIYHYREFLRLNPKAENAGVITQRIESCKIQLASNVISLPSTPATQKQLEDLVEKNHKLQDEVDKWRAYYIAQQNAPKPVPDAGAGNSPASGAGSPIPDDISTPGSSTMAGNAAGTARTIVLKPAPKPSAKRTYTVAAGETLASIARKSGVSLTALRAANPSVSPSKMRVGQVLNLPAP